MAFFVAYVERLYIGFFGMLHNTLLNLFSLIRANSNTTKELKQAYSGTLSRRNFRRLKVI